MAHPKACILCAVILGCLSNMQLGGIMASSDDKGQSEVCRRKCRQFWCVDIASSNRCGVLEDPCGGI
jgi:hypothetical protein